jgi:gluconolactonase
MVFKSTALVLLALAFRTANAANTTAFIDPELTYLLPPQYSRELQQNFMDTNTTNISENAQFVAAQKAPFISYDPEFTALLGPNPTMKLAAQREAPFADEAVVWVSDRNEVWFTSSTVNNQSHFMVLDLKTSKTYTPRTSIPIVNPNGGYYFNGIVYIAATGTFTEALCIYGIDPSSGETRVILNSYFGLQFNGPHDIT